MAGGPPGTLKALFPPQFLKTLHLIGRPPPQPRCPRPQRWGPSRPAQALRPWLRGPHGPPMPHRSRPAPPSLSLLSAWTRPRGLASAPSSCRTLAAGGRGLRAECLPPERAGQRRRPGQGQPCAPGRGSIMSGCLPSGPSSQQRVSGEMGSVRSPGRWCSGFEPRSASHLGPALSLCSRPHMHHLQAGTVGISD